MKVDQILTAKNRFAIFVFILRGVHKNNKCFKISCKSAYKYAVKRVNPTSCSIFNIL